MKKGEKKRQQKALARRTERKAKQKTTRSVLQVNPALNIIRQARKYPLLGCWTMENWDQGGLAVVVVARRQSDGLVVFGSFEVDYYCLGVKEAYCNADVPYRRFLDEYLPRMMVTGPPLEIAPDLAHELIYSSIEYAARWGFHPHPDFKLAQQVLDPPEQHPRTGKVAFGKDGKPLYISGPYDNVQAILHQLERTAGDGNFHFMAHFDGPPFNLLESSDEGWND
jgi:hypothetical protein